MIRFLICCTLLLSLTTCQQRDDVWLHVQETGVLRVGVDPTYPPFATADQTSIYGLDIDLANALAADLGLQTEFVQLGYDGLYDALATGQVDVLISALVIAPERTRDFAYSEPYFNAGEILIIPDGQTDIAEMTDLGGRTLAVELGALGHVEAIAWAEEVPDMTVIPYPTAAEGMGAVASGEADAALVDAISGRLFLQTAPQLQRVHESVTAEPFALVVRIADQRLLDELNGSLNQLQQSGEMDRIIGRWLDEIR
jgi:polar amino acid transport system substrate-binding protein